MNRGLYMDRTANIKQEEIFTDDLSTSVLEHNLEQQLGKITITRNTHIGENQYDVKETEYMEVYKSILETIPQLRSAFRKKSAAACKQGYVVSWDKQGNLKRLKQLLKVVLPDSRLKRQFAQNFSFGNQYFEVIGDRPYRRYIRELQADQVSYDFDKKVYIYENSISGKTEEINARRIVHFRNNFESAGQFLYGRSDLRQLIDILNGYNVLQSYTPVVIKTFLKPLVYAKLTEATIDDERAISDVYDQLVTLRKSGIGVASNNVEINVEDFKDVGKPGIDYLEFLTSIIAVSTDIPPMFLGNLTTTEASARILQDTYYDDIESSQHDVEEVINNKLLPLLILPEDKINEMPMDDFNNFILIDYTGELPELRFKEPIRLSKESRVKLVKDLYTGDNKVFTYNEAREFIDLPNINHDNLVSQGDFKTINAIQNLLDKGGIDHKEAQSILGLERVGGVVSPNTKYQVDAQVMMQEKGFDFQREMKQMESNDTKEQQE